jgi:hypothetical protein
MGMRDQLAAKALAQEGVTNMATSGQEQAQAQSMLEQMQALVAQFQAAQASISPITEKSPKEQRMLESMHRFILATQLHDATMSSAPGAELALEHLKAIFAELQSGGE